MTNTDDPSNGPRLRVGLVRTLATLAVLALFASCDSSPAETVPAAPTSAVPNSGDIAALDPIPSEVGAAPAATTGLDPGSPVATTGAVPAPFELTPAGEPTGTVSHGSLVFDGRERTYRLYVPTDLPSGQVPLFIGLHGGTGWGDQFAQTNHIEGLAESNGFIVVHPDGVEVAGGPGGVWNGGICCGVAARDGIDDVGFIGALIDQLEADHQIDPRRVYAFGHSNGAIMSYRLACELADRVVGIGMYAGNLGVEGCDPVRPVSVMHVHGTADTNLPLAGGVGADSIAGVDFPPPRDGFATIAEVQGCPPPSTSVVGDITVDSSEPCAGGVATEFVTIESATHAWPGGTPLRVPTSGAGYGGYDATAEIVSFLLAHPRS